MLTGHLWEWTCRAGLTCNMQWLPYTSGSFVPGLFLVTSFKVSYKLLIYIFANSLNSCVFESLIVQDHRLCEPVSNFPVRASYSSSVSLSHSMYRRLLVLNKPSSNCPFTCNPYIVDMGVCMHICIHTHVSLRRRDCLGLLLTALFILACPLVPSTQRHSAGLEQWMGKQM